VVEQMAESLGEAGFAGHLLFVALLTACGVPVAWGFSVILAAAGYVYGWAAMPACEVGTVSGALFGFYVSRFTMKTAVKRQVGALSHQRRAQVHALLAGLTTRETGFVLFASMRMTPILAYGWVNGIAGALTDMPVGLYFTSTLVGTQMDIVSRIYLGTAIRTLTDTSSSNVTLANAVLPDDPSAIPMLVVQIVAMLLVIIVPSVIGNRILRRLLRKSQLDATRPPGRTEGVIV